MLKLPASFRALASRNYRLFMVGQGVSLVGTWMQQTGIQWLVYAKTGSPAMLGAVPDHVRVESFIPQAEVLPGCGAVVCHGGSGTILAALAHGLPVVCIPQGADQFANAANVERVGADFLELTAPAGEVLLAHAAVAAVQSRDD